MKRDKVLATGQCVTPALLLMVVHCYMLARTLDSHLTLGGHLNNSLVDELHLSADMHFLLTRCQYIYQQFNPNKTPTDLSIGLPNLAWDPATELLS